ncbi:MAG: hypothetical protein ACI4JN_03665 [Ruminococcus sp.]
MADHKYTVEDILSEYGQKDTGEKTAEKLPSGKLEMHRMLRNGPSSAARQPGSSERPAPFRRAQDESKINRIKREVRSSSRPDIESSRAAAFQTLELMREKVSFVNSAAADPRTTPEPKNDRIEGYEGAVVVESPETDGGKAEKSSYVPNIRTMEDSTRAREEKLFGRKKRKSAENRYEYKKDTAEEKKTSGAEVKTEDESKPFFFDLHHADAVKFISREAREERERRRRVSAIRRLRKKRMKMREAEEQENGEEQNVHIQNNDAEIRANINILRKTVSFRTIALGALFVIGAALSIAESTGGAYDAILSAIGGSGYSFIHMLLGMAAVMIAFPTIANGVRYLFVNRADSDSMAAMPIVVSTLCAVVSTLASDGVESREVHLFVPAAIFILFMNALGKQLIIHRAIKNFSVISGKYEQYVLTYVNDETDAEKLTKGVQPDYPILVSMRKARQMSDFLRYTYSEDMGDRFCRKASPLICGGSLIIAAAITGIRITVMPGNVILGFFLSVFSMLLCGCCCAGIMLTANIPLDIAANKLSKRGCGLLGYQSVDDFYDANSLMVTASSLFPESAVSIEGMKPFRDAKIEDVILMASGLAQQADSVLKYAFEKMLDQENSSIPAVDSVLYEENYGLSGWIKNRRILLGNREMMVQHNIEGLPSPLREAEYSQEGCEVLYFSVSGVLSAMMLVRLTANNRMKHQLHKLMEENVVLVVKSVDSFVTHQLIAGLYQIPENCIKVIPVAAHEIFDKYTSDSENISASAITSGSAADTIRLLVSARRIRRSTMAGIILQSVAAIIGFGIALVYIGLSAYTSVTVQMFLIFQIAASLVTAIAVRLK